MLRTGSAVGVAEGSGIAVAVGTAVEVGSGATAVAVGCCETSAGVSAESEDPPQAMATGKIAIARNPISRRMERVKLALLSG